MNQKSKLLELFFYLELPRYIENKMLNLLRLGKISKWFSGIGQEAISVGATYALEDNDIILPMHRNLGVFTTRDVDLKSLFCQLMGKEGGFTKGRDRSFHFGLTDKNIIGMISHLAAMIPVAAGLGLAFNLKKQKRIALSFIGDGATSEGDFHEAINLAAVWNLPVIFLIENNGYGLSTPSSEQFICKKLSDRAKGYGIRGLTIDGNDVLKVYKTILAETKRIRNGSGPIIIEALTFRMRGHEEASGVEYVPKALMKKWANKDPIKRFRQYLTSISNIEQKDLDELDAKIRNIVDPAIDFAINSKQPLSDINSELDDVFAKPLSKIKKPQGNKKQMRYVDAISDALHHKMSHDPKLILMGQDICEYGGVFKVTKDFKDDFGKERVRNTPITESAVLGAAIGLSLEGFKTVVEMQFADFVACGFNQIVNNIAKTHYRWGKPINVTVRLPYGGGMSAGPFHSQCPEAWFMHVPGLKILAPSNPIDAKGLLHSAIEDPNPVLFFEHKGLYRSIKEEVSTNYYNIEIGKAKIIKHGKDLTIISYGKAITWVTDYIAKHNQEDIDIELIDLRTLSPLDWGTIENSVAKTNRILIIHEANLTGGIGAEVSSYISENCFTNLDAPIMRLGALDMPVPFSNQLENEIYLPVSRIEEKIKELVNY